MRHVTIFTLTALLTLNLAKADAIRFEQIPADVEGFAFIDIDRLLSSNLLRQTAMGLGLSADFTADQMKQAIGAQLNSVTIYTAGGTEKTTVLVRAHDLERLKKMAAESKDVVVFSYQGQSVHYSPAATPMFKLQGTWSASRRTTKPSKDGAKMEGYYITLGIEDAWNPLEGPSYTAFVGDDLMVITGDLRAMAAGMDVLQGRKPSLANQDPNNLKSGVPAGAMIVGAGMTANFRGAIGEAPKNGDATTKPAAPQKPASTGFDLFAPITGKAKLARVAIWEDEQSEHVSISIGMTDAESAEQLKNLVVGVKSLVFLSQEMARPFLAPLDVQTTGTSVTLQWSYPTAKLVELMVQESRKGNDSSASTTRPATRGI